MSELDKLQLPGNIYNWIGSFLFNRHQICRYGGYASKLASFNRGFVQGSGVGPTLFVILALDLNTLSGSNELIKFADDSTLLVPEDSDTDLETEFNNILAWANINSMVINLAKTKELIFYNPIELDLSLFHLLYPLLSVSHQLNSLAYTSKITLNVIFILSIL